MHVDEARAILTNKFPDKKWVNQKSCGMKDF